MKLSDFVSGAGHLPESLVRAVVRQSGGWADFQEMAGDVANHGTDGWTIEALAINWEDPDLYCDHCGNRIESAYAEDDAQ